MKAKGRGSETYHLIEVDTQRGSRRKIEGQRKSRVKERC